MLVAFNTTQYCEFLVWRRTTSLDAAHYTLVTVEAGYDPTGVYHCWVVWELTELCIQEYFYNHRVGSNNMYTTQLSLDFGDE